MSGWMLLALAALALVEARRAAARDRAVNPPDRGDRATGSVRVLSALGRRPAVLLARQGLEVSAFQAGAGMAFGVLAVLAFIVIGGLTGVVAALALAGFGTAYPGLWLRAAAARRAERIERRVPELVELGAELDLAYANIALGRPRADELRDLAARTGSSSLAQLALTLRLSDRLGVPLAESLRRQADRSRTQRARDVQERAARAGPRVLVVVVFVLVPAALLPLAAAVLLTVSGSLSGF